MDRPAQGVPQARVVDILLVDNSDDEMFITRLAFERTGRPVTLHHVRDGRQCLDFLHRRGAHAGAPAINLVLLDLHMIGMDGREVLAAITGDPALCHLPVVMLSNSDYERDVLDCHRLRCSSFLTKPVDLDHYTAALRTLYDYWFTLVQRPKARPPRPG